MRNVLLTIAILLSVLSGFVSYAADEKLTITTYYPSPSGVYKNLRLMPGTDPGDCVNANAPIGKLFFNATAGSVYACTQISGSNYGYRPESQFWALNTASATVSPVDTSYRVGIGTNVASSKLTIVGGAIELSKQSVAYQPFVNPTTRGQGAEMTFWAPDEAAYAPYYWTHNAGRIYGKMPIHDWMWTQLVLQAGNNWDAFVQNQLVLRGNGKVGIGTDNPQARLDVTVGGSGPTDYTARFSSNSSIAGAGGILFDQNSTYAYKLWTQSTHYTHGDLRIAYINRSTGADVYYPILTLRSGNVGIGNAAPLEKLDVTGNVRMSGNAKVAGNVYSGGEMIGTIQSGWGQARHIAGNYGVIQRNDGSDYYILITAAGNQYGGWNSLRPFYIHLADGTVGSQSNMNGAGALTGGEIRASNGIFRSWQRSNFFLALQGDRHMVLYDNNRAIWYTGTNISDGRLKKNVTELKDVLPGVLGLRPVRFLWNDESMGTKPEIGVISQEVESLYPELVFTDKSGNKLVDYPKLSVLLLGAVKEQQKKIASLDKKVESLTEAVESLRRSRRK